MRADEFAPGGWFPRARHGGARKIEGYRGSKENGAWKNVGARNRSVVTVEAREYDEMEECTTGEWLPLKPFGGWLPRNLRGMAKAGESSTGRLLPREVHES